MPHDFSAIPEPPGSLCTAVAALAPTNPFYTPSYIQARRSLGFQPWLLALSLDGRIVSGCSAFMRSGHVNRSLEISSIPSLSNPDTFWHGLLQFCSRHHVSYLAVNSFASSSAAIPSLTGEIGRAIRSEYVLDLQELTLWKGLSSNHRRNVKRGRTTDLQVRRARDAEACLEHAYLVNASLSRRESRGESVPHDIQLRSFLALAQSGAGEFFQAILAGKVLSSLLILLADRGAYYQSAGTSVEGMACGASHFLIHQVADILGRQSFEVFNLGGANPHNPGLERFKAGFGATTVNLEAAEFFLGSDIRKKLSTIAALVRDVVNSHRRTRIHSH